MMDHTPKSYLGETTMKFRSQDKTTTIVQSIVVDAKGCDEGDRKARDIFKSMYPNLDYFTGSLWVDKNWERKLT